MKAFSLRGSMGAVKADIYDLHRKVSGIGMHVENFTDKNVQLIAENFIELTKKLNMAIPAPFSDFSGDL